MNGAEVHGVLVQKGIDLLYHANTVTTSLAFLQLGGLASRERVERDGFRQTEQYTDNTDKRDGIWNDVFTDTVDIHARIRNANDYGPVLFVLNAAVLTALPAQTEIWVTRTNPCKWTAGLQTCDRYFQTTAQLATGLTKGTFDQIITFRVTNGVIPFGAYLQDIILDNLRVSHADGEERFIVAQRALRTAARTGRITTSITRRNCGSDCRCHAKYEGDANLVRKNFAVP